MLVPIGKGRMGQALDLAPRIVDDGRRRQRTSCNDVRDPNLERTDDVNQLGDLLDERT